MLIELSVRNLGIIAEAQLAFGPGMTALTGETGAGKTLLVQSMQLLVGARAEGHLVGPHSDEAIVEGRFEDKGEEFVVRRVISSSGRSRAYLNGSMVTLKELSEVGSRLVDLHSQHAQQSLLSSSAQRSALDQFAGIELEPLRSAKLALRDLAARLEQSGGDERARLREMELLRYQVDEISAASLDDPFEEAELEALESLLSDATAHREAAERSVEKIYGDGGAVDLLGEAMAALRGRAPFASALERIEGIGAELSDVANELRDTSERISVDPEALEEVRARRQHLRDLCRKYGENVGAVIEFGILARKQLEELEHHEELAAVLEQEILAATATVAELAQQVGAARRHHCEQLAREVQARFSDLAMPNAYLRVSVGEEDPGDDVQFLFEANNGAKPLPLSKVASGGELARIMLGLRLVLSSGPPTMIFDEVDAGVGGNAALSVGSALGELGQDRQVLVVTHLPQVAAAANVQVSIYKDADSDTVVSNIHVLSPVERLNELARMLSGNASDVAIEHARELLLDVRARRSS